MITTRSSTGLLAIKVVLYNPVEHVFTHMHWITYEFYPSYSTFYGHLETHFDFDHTKSIFTVLRVNDSNVEVINDEGNPSISGATHVVVFPISATISGGRAIVFTTSDNLMSIINCGMSNTEMRHVSYVGKEATVVSYNTA
ncbi:hypothetical protein GGH92_006649 [Coemansia sp. RSA 2673]|nr:hypothetical protein GGH92_006649 [Coemansia sp. RSA 2673]